MKSKTPLFNKHIAANLMKRFWPIWAAYLIVLAFQLPVNVFSQLETARYFTKSAEYFTVLSGYGTIKFSFIFAIVSVTAMFSYLYSSRSCCMVCALPIKRETMFLSCAAAGILPFLISDILIFAVSAAMGVAEIKYLLLWLGITVMGNMLFYGMALFCAVLTGNIAILPLLYIVLNFTGSVVQNCFIYSFSRFVYGMRKIGGNILGYLTPVRVLGRHLSVIEETEGVIELSGMEFLIAYFAAGLLLAAAAFFIYKKRHMENAGDIVAVKSLRPIFKYCMTFGTALVLATVVGKLLPPSVFKGIGSAVIVLLFMLLGAAVGWYGAEMMMQKSFYVFKSKFKGLIISCLIIAAVVMGAEFNISGYENRIPKFQNVSSVNVEFYNIKQPENIEKVMQLHESLIKNKHSSDNSVIPGEYDSFVGIHYFMNNGQELSREYELNMDPENFDDDSSSLRLYSEVINCPEVIKQRYIPETPVTAENVSFCQISESYPSEYGGTTRNIKLDGEQAEELFKTCILPDIEESLMGRQYMDSEDGYLDNISNLKIEIQLNAEFTDQDGKFIPAAWDGFFCSVDLSAKRTIKWIEENTDLEVTSLREVMPESYFAY